MALHFNAKDLMGERFVHLEVVRLADQAERKPGSGLTWVCRCDCGTEIAVRGKRLTRGEKRSCGCKDRELHAKAMTKHGAYKGGKRSPEYTTWINIWQRCTNPKHKAYKNYGARGIMICERWRTFENFLSDMGPRPQGMTIERKDGGKGYEPTNCVWADWHEQANNRRGNRMITVAGVSRTLAEWSRLSGISHDTIAGRLKRGWTPEDAMRVAVGQKR